MTGSPVLPLTAAQKAIWLAQQLSPDVPFVIAQFTELRGSVDLEALVAANRRAYRELCSGSVRLIEVDGEPHVAVDEEAVVAVTVVDLRGRDAPVRAAREWMRRDCTSAVDMYDGDLVVSRVLRLADDHCYWYSRAHHIALDGYGAMLLISRTAELYLAARTDGEPPEPAAADPAGLLGEDLKYQNSQRRHRDRQFWREEAGDLPAVVSLGSGVGSPGAAAHVVGDSVSTQDGARLDRAGLRSAATVVAAFAAFLGLMCGADDIVLSLPVSARTTALLRKSAGSVSNVLPLRLRTAVSVSVGDAVANTQLALTRVLRHQRYRREDIGRDGESNAVGPAFFGPVVNLMMFKQQISLGEITGRVQVLSTGPTADLTVNVYPGSTDSLPCIDFEGNPGVYSEDDLAQYHHRFMAFLGRFAAADPSTPVAELDLFLPGERADFAPGSGAADADPVLLPHLLERTVAHMPDATAVVGVDGTLTYAELDRRADRLASSLAARGIGPETFVAVAITRSIESVVALWAVAKTGAAYVPVDPGHPAGRISYTVSDSGARVGVTVAGVRDRLPDSLDWLVLDTSAHEERARETGRVRHRNPAHPAYVIYTSGSTGTPKGVVVTHSGLANLAREIQEKYGITARSRVLHLASPTFDTALVEVVAAALHGAALVIAPPTAFGGGELTDFLRAHWVTHLLATPSALATVDPAGLGSVESVVVGGEACPPALVHRWAARREMRNAYGPTETTCSVTLSAPMHPAGEITLGPLMRGVHAVVLDHLLHPQPPGAGGELHLAGPCLARGYHGQPALTAAKFVANPFGKPGSRMFRSGDQVRWTATGELQFLGRTDDQVKIRGLRIELGEIDTVLTGHPGVRFAVTTVHHRTAGDPALVAYIAVDDPTTFDVDALRAHSGRSLPDYMVPAAIMIVEQVPLTPTGKLDRAALPAPRFAAATRYREPATPAERRVADTFAQVLGVSGVGAEHSFFDLGGDSLSATRVVARINDEFGSVLGVREVFDAPTVTALAARITWATEPDEAQLGALPVPAHIPLSPAQRHLDRAETTRPLYNIPFTIAVRGRFDHQAFGDSVADVIERHPLLRTIFPDTESGPQQYLLDVGDALPDLTPTPAGGDDLVTAVVATAFDVRTEPPVRIRVLEHGPHHHLIACAVHHIAVDGWSLAPLARDLVLAYTARSTGTAPQWPELPVDYTDYTLWQRARLGDEHDPTSRAATQIAYWREQLAGPPRPLVLPSDRPRPAQWSYAGARMPFVIDPAAHHRLLDVAHTHRTGVFTALRSAVSILLARLSGDTDVIVGTPIAGRGHPRLDSVVGMFVNTVALRARIRPGMTLHEVMAEARETELQAFAHADVPFERLVEVLDPPRSPSLHPFFQVAISLENFTHAELDAPDLSFSITPRPLDIAKCDLHFHFTERYDPAGAPNGIDAAVVYSTDLFDTESIRSLVTTLQTVITTEVPSPASTGELGEELPAQAAAAPLAKDASRSQPGARLGVPDPDPSPHRPTLRPGLRLHQFTPVAGAAAGRSLDPWRWCLGGGCRGMTTARVVRRGDRVDSVRRPRPGNPTRTTPAREHCCGRGDDHHAMDTPPTAICTGTALPPSLHPARGPARHPPPFPPVAGHRTADHPLHRTRRRGLRDHAGPRHPPTDPHPPRGRHPRPHRRRSPAPGGLPQCPDRTPHRRRDLGLGLGRATPYRHHRHTPGNIQNLPCNPDPDPRRPRRQLGRPSDHPRPGDRHHHQRAHRYPHRGQRAHHRPTHMLQPHTRPAPTTLLGRMPAPFLRHLRPLTDAPAPGAVPHRKGLQNNMNTNDSDHLHDVPVPRYEHEMILPPNLTRGSDADTDTDTDTDAAAGRELHERVGADDSSPADRSSDETPIRHVHLPKRLRDRLDTLARRHHRDPSDLLREAAEEYVQKHSADPAGP
ncbi:amino acid adenylation domain-containing protein [Rhodococcus sp. T2V]|uniref:non-ribosomal peptide synthetase n=1 Tax=Rhodococcus sp. T2V TaxID=3034164 RepID=UPI0023E2CE86|nr:non-ribosomal peptide synthetase [Rhodococcus sp. T2V]MDF3312868.1 amino acid adenylation domain-containing protein [Rhodococcus sp. T2V]